MILLAANCNAAYYPRVRSWLESVNAHANVPAAFIGYDFLPPSDYACIQPYGILASQVQSLERTYCLQHGEFLKVMPHLHDDDDIVIFTDCGDLIMQRPLMDREIQWIEQIPYIAVGYNKCPPWDNFLTEEAERLEPFVTTDAIVDRFPDCDKMVCYNMGVIVARVGFYKQVSAQYNELYDDVKHTFHGSARQQWLLSYILGTWGITPVILPTVFHAHDCYGVPSGVHWHDDVLYSGEYPVLFKHKFLGGPPT